MCSQDSVRLIPVSPVPFAHKVRHGKGLQIADCGRIVQDRVAKQRVILCSRPYSTEL